MIVFRNARELENFLSQKKKNSNQIGFVPTMGALHMGHMALIHLSVSQNDITVCSIFVNPTQFNDPDDFKNYPVTIENDILLLESSGCDVLFLPPVTEIYPYGTQNLQLYDLGFIETVLEGKFRTGHFQGVCQVVHRLLEFVAPHNLYLGQKDYQQTLVVKKILFITAMDKKINLKVAPTVREPDGLAMSSRNKRLSSEARSIAPVISKTLEMVKQNLKPGKTNEILHAATSQLESAGLKTEYVDVVNAATLESVIDWDGKLKVIVLAAVFAGGVRLIDNLIIN